MKNVRLQHLLAEFSLTTSQTPDLDSWEIFLQKLDNHCEITESELTQVKTAALKNAKAATLGDLVGGIAHEVNNPLTVLQLRSEQLLELVESNEIKKEFFVKSLTSIGHTVTKISGIINGLRSFAKSDSSDPLAFRSVKDIADSTFALLSNRFHSHGVKLEVTCPQDFQLQCCSAELSQVFIHLVNNAFEAVSDLEEKWVHVEISADAFTVTDSGTGIEESIQTQISVPFFTTKINSHKVGLGLSIANQIVESYGGTLTIDTHSPNTKFVARFKPSASNLKAS